MKTTLIKGYGTSGRKVEFNLMDCYASGHTVERINTIQAFYQEHGFIPADQYTEVMNILDNVSVLLAKIALDSAEEATIFTPDEDEPVHNEKEQC